MEEDHPEEKCVEGEEGEEVEEVEEEEGDDDELDEDALDYVSDMARKIFKNKTFPLPDRATFFKGLHLKAYAINYLTS